MSLSLNEEQLAGVNAIDGDYVMIAGPGSGKTRVLVERYLRMVTQRQISQRDILNLTFTNAAASEMVERVGLMDADKVFRTFHSLALDICKKERNYLPFKTCPTIIPVRGEQFALMKDLLKFYPAISGYRPLSEAITRWKAENMDPSEAVAETANMGPEYFMAAAYRDYERICREQGWLDFDSLMKETVLLLENNDEVRVRHQRKYIAVDECQDTDITQFRLLQLLYGGNIFAVGDESQLIYAWRSAQAGNLTNFSKTFQGAKTLFLGTNYRSTKKLVEFFKQILPVDNGLASHMKSARPEGEGPRFIRYTSDDEEANEVLTEIVDRDIQESSAIIARTNRQLQLIQRRAMSRNIKAEILGKNANVWESNEVKHLIELTKERRNDLRPAHVVMSELMRQHNLTYRYANTGNPQDKDPVENMNDIIRMAGRKNKETQQPLSVPDFLEWLRKITFMRRTNKNPILTLTTVHQAKGREWPHVFVVGCEQGKMPHINGDLPEEARIFFVACSRAADELQISYYQNRSQFLNQFEEEVEIFGEEDDE
ncbi:ATP-dependent DNA helicase Rep [uncultured archaeon]|nr:ATP-dependent DNA helicase Rep [uncultured archaeon]